MKNEGKGNGSKEYPPCSCLVRRGGGCSDVFLVTAGQRDERDSENRGGDGMPSLLCLNHSDTACRVPTMLSLNRTFGISLTYS